MQKQWRGCVVGSLLALVSTTALAVSTSADSLLAVDQNRSEIVAGLVEKWKDYLNAGKADDLRKTLMGLRADRLLAVSLAQDQKQFAALLEKDDFLPVKGGRANIEAKVLGDGNTDVVYTPVTPCRIFYTEIASGGAGGALLPGVTRTFDTRGSLTGQGGAAGCSVPNTATAIVLQMGAFSSFGLGWINAGPQGSPIPTGVLLAYNNVAFINATSVTLKINPANGQFSAFSNNNQTELYGDVLGYFAKPTNVTSAGVTATGSNAAAVGGSNNSASGLLSGVWGGVSNTASGDRSVVLGGGFNTASGRDSIAMGCGAIASNPGSVVIAATAANPCGSDSFFSSAAANEIAMRGTGGFRFITNPGGSNVTIVPGATLDFGSQVRQMIQLWGGPNAYGIGVQAGTQYYRLDNSLETDPGGFAWYRGGVHNDATFNPGAGGTAIMTLNRGGQLAFPDTTSSFQQILMRGIGNGNGFGAQTFTTYTRTNDAVAFYRLGTHTTNAVDAGTGGAILATIHNGGTGAASVVIGTVRAQAFQATSDRNVKTAFAKVDVKSVLAKVAALPISSWMYKNEQGLGVRHLGPVAQDFKRAFNVGSDDKTISTVDADGVALAAIQGLHQIVKEKDAEIATLKREMEVIKKKLGL